jgi:hypothetical protein
VSRSDEFKEELLPKDPQNGTCISLLLSNKLAMQIYHDRNTGESYVSYGFPLVELLLEGLSNV